MVWRYSKTQSTPNDSNSSIDKQQIKLYPTTSWQYPIINYLDLDIFYHFYTLMSHIVNLHSQYVLFTFFYPLFFSCYVHCTAVYTVCCPVHSFSLTVVLPDRTIYSHFVYFSSKVGLLAEIWTPRFVGRIRHTCTREFICRLHFRNRKVGIFNRKSADFILALYVK